MRIFTDTFTISDVDPKGKVLDNITTLQMKSEDASLYIDCYAPAINYNTMDKVEVSIYTDKNEFAESSIPEKYKYVMGNGVIYTKEDKEEEQYIEMSFSGLLGVLTLHKTRIKEEDKYRRLYIGIAPCA